MTPSPRAIEKASNPIALRYWNQCVEKSSDSSPASSSPSSPTSSSSSNVVKILSTAGSGIKRENEVNEARSNINRFITIDQVRKRDNARLQRSQSQTRPVDTGNTGHHSTPGHVKIPTSRSYNLVKEEQIKLSQERVNFQNRSANFVVKSPQPFRRGVSETRSVPVQQHVETTNTTNQNTRNSNWNLNNISFEISNLNDNQKANIVLMLLQQLPSDVSDKITKENLSKLPDSRLYSVLDGLSDKVGHK